MAHAIKISRSDLFPIGTTVRAFPFGTGSKTGRKPSGAELASAVVDATGKLELTGLPDLTQAVLWAEVGGEHRTLNVGDPARDVVGTLSQRRRRRRALAKA